MYGGVVNKNGIEHTKALYCQSQITGNLQGILIRFHTQNNRNSTELRTKRQIVSKFIREFKIKNRENISIFNQIINSNFDKHCSKHMSRNLIHLFYKSSV